MRKYLKRLEAAKELVLLLNWLHVIRGDIYEDAWRTASLFGDRLDERGNSRS